MSDSNLVATLSNEAGTVAEMARRMCSDQGDGRATSALLANAILAYGRRQIASGAHPAELRIGVERAARVVDEVLIGISRPVETEARKRHVATTFAQDREVGGFVGAALHRCEKALTVRTSADTDPTVSVARAVRLSAPRGGAVRELEDALVVVCDGGAAALHDIDAVIARSGELRRPVVVVASEMPLRLRTPAAACVVAVHEPRRAILADLAALTGAELIESYVGLDFEELGLGQLGRAAHVVAGPLGTWVLVGEDPPLHGRVTTFAFDAAVIGLGRAAAKRTTFDEAIRVTTGAISAGAVPGAGLGYLRGLAVLELEDQHFFGDKKLGERVLARALAEPSRTLAARCGLDPDAAIAEMRRTRGAAGFDLETGRFVDLDEAGILDSTLVVRGALRNAVAISVALLAPEASAAAAE